MLNLTPHLIRVMCPETGEVVELPPSGLVARVTTTETVVGFEIVGTLRVPTVAKVFGQVEGLPEGWFPGSDRLLVSGMVAAAMPGVFGVYAPDTGPTAVRREGQVWAVTRLTAA